jgi:hypothetical protein
MFTGIGRDECGRLVRAANGRSKEKQGERAHP